MARRADRRQSIFFFQPPMSDLQARFEAAEANTILLTERPDNVTLLKLYACFKLGT